MSTPGTVPTCPGPALPPGVQERTIEAGGVKFRCLAGGVSQGEPLLLLHGWPTWAEVWLPSLQVLGQRHAWIAPDLPSQNRSSSLPGKDRSMTAYRTALRALVDHLEWPRFSIVGNSMGASLALMMALDRPQRVSRVAAIDCAGLNAKFPGRTTRLYLPFALGCYLGAPGPGSVRKLLNKAVFHDPKFSNDAWVHALVANMAPKDRRSGYLATGVGLGKPDASVRSSLAQVQQPVLIASGRDDVQFTWQSAEEASHLLPHGQFAAIDGAGHFPMVEKPQETAKLLDAFLSP